MFESINTFTFEQPVKITYKDIYGTQTSYFNGGYSVNDVPYQNKGLAQNSTLYPFQQIGKFLEFKFRVPLKVRNKFPKRIGIKNINTCYTSAGAYETELICPSLFKDSVQFLDATSAFGYHYEYPGEGWEIPDMNPEFTVRLLSGLIPTKNNPYNGTELATNRTDPDTGVVYQGADKNHMFIKEIGYKDFLPNPSLGFNLIFEWTEKPKK